MAVRFVLYYILICGWAVYPQTEFPVGKVLPLHKKYIDSAVHYAYSKDLTKYITYSYKAIELLSQKREDHITSLKFYSDFGWRLKELGLIKESTKQYNAFFDFYEKNAGVFSEKHRHELIKNLSVNYGALAHNYYLLNQPDSATYIHKKNIALTENTNTIYHISALNNFGLYQLDLKETETALFYFNKAKDIIEKSFPDIHLYGSIRDNIADIYYESRRVVEAAQLYKDNFAFYKITPYEENKFFPIDYVRLMSAGRQLLESQVEMQKIEEATRTMEEMRVYYRNPEIPQTSLEYLTAQKILYVGERKYRQAFEALQEANGLQDSLAAAELKIQNELQAILNEIALDRIKANLLYEKEHKQNIINRQRLRFWVVVLLLALIASTTIFLYLRRKQKLIIAEEKAKNTEIINRQLHHEVVSKQRDLSDFAINLNQSQQWAKDLKDHLENLKKTKGRKRKNLFIQLEQEVKTKISYDKETQEFYKRLDELSDAFYKKLRQQFPGLTKVETRLCSLIRLKIDSKEIATIQNITISSVNTARYRLKRKLNLPQNTSLDDFIQSL